MVCWSAKRGVGTQVVHGQIRRSVEISSLYDDLARSGMSPTTSVLIMGLVAVDDAILTPATDLLPAERVLHLRRLRFANGEPLALMENYLPADFADIPQGDLETHGLYELMRNRGVHIRVVKQRIEARRETSEECQRLTDDQEHRC